MKTARYPPRVAPRLLDKRVMPPTRACPVNAAGAQGRVGRSSGGCCLELIRNPRPLPTIVICPRELGWPD